MGIIDDLLIPVPRQVPHDSSIAFSDLLVMHDHAFRCRPGYVG
jgi:hypothetical protein